MQAGPSAEQEVTTVEMSTYAMTPRHAVVDPARTGTSLAAMRDRSIATLKATNLPIATDVVVFDGSAGIREQLLWGPPV